MSRLAAFPTLRSERLLLREHGPGDAGAFFALRSAPEVVRYTGVPLYTARAEAEDYLRRVAGGWRSGESFTWALCRPDEDAMLGSICLWNPSGDAYDIGYEMLAAGRGRGYMLEAARAVTGWAFAVLGVAAVLADPREENVASVRLLERCGFVVIGRRQEADGMHLLMRLGAPLGL